MTLSSDKPSVHFRSALTLAIVFDLSAGTGGSLYSDYACGTCVSLLYRVRRGGSTSALRNCPCGYYFAFYWCSIVIWVIVTVLFRFCGNFLGAVEMRTNGRLYIRYGAFTLSFLVYFPANCWLDPLLLTFVMLKLYEHERTAS